MYTIRLVATLALLTVQGGMAIAAEHPELQSENARKALLVLQNLDLDHPDVVNLVAQVDKRVEDGYLRIAEERVMGGTLKLHYELHGGITSKQAELRFTPDDSNFVYTARTNALMANYKINF